MPAEPAPAKINLYLHVLGRLGRTGITGLDSLVAFADIADEVSAAPAPTLTLDVTGPFAASLGVRCPTIWCGARGAGIGRTSRPRARGGADARQEPAGVVRHRRWVERRGAGGAARTLARHCGRAPEQLSRLSPHRSAPTCRSASRRAPRGSAASARPGARTGACRRSLWSSPIQAWRLPPPPSSRRAPVITPPPPASTRRRAMRPSSRRSSPRAATISPTPRSRRVPAIHRCADAARRDARRTPRAQKRAAATCFAASLRSGTKPYEMPRNPRRRTAAGG